MKQLAIVGALFATALMGACGECAGTPSCTTEPVARMHGQIIEHRSGAGVGNVRLQFVRTSGIEVDSDVIEAVTDDEGFFTLRTGSVYVGEFRGDLTVTPPAPWAPYTVRDVAMTTSRRRGDGAVLSRWVVNPFLLLVGEVHDGTNGGPLPGSSVTMRRLSGGRLDEDTKSFVTEGARFYWIYPEVIDPSPITFEFEVRVPDDPIVYRDTQTVQLQHVEGHVAFVMLILPRP